MDKDRTGIDKTVIRRVCTIAGFIVLNTILSFLTYRFGLPIYLDSIGTVVITAIGGLLPGIITAVMTNLVCSLFNSFSPYYSLISILIACMTVWFGISRGTNKRSKIILFILSAGAMSGILGSIFQWMLLSGPQFTDVAEVSEMFSSNTGIPRFITSTLVITGLNLIDKGLSVIAALLILKYLPAEVCDDIKNSVWRQKPLGSDEIKKISSVRYRSNSLGKRLSVMLTIGSVMLAFVMAYAGLTLYYGRIKAEYRENAEKAAAFAASVVDPGMVDEYVASRADPLEYDGEGYRSTRELLGNIRSSIPGIKYLYVYQIGTEGCRIVFDTDEEYESQCRLGDVLPFEGSFIDLVPALLAGERIEPLENTGIFGYLLTAYEPIYDGSGRCVAYAGADVSLSLLEGYVRDFALRFILIFSGSLILVLAAGLWVSRYYLIYPIGSMTVSTNGFVRDVTDEDNLEEVVKKIKTLDIRTGDEVEELYLTVCRMASGLAEHIRDIRHYADATAQMQNGLIITMADMVESRDSDTGAHVQKTSAYVKIILEGLKKKGYYLNKLTPKYMSDVVMSAPLHDVGKINIPDAILNKPGKLTDEEYTIMKTHTTAGKNIIENAISTVKGENYLKEARNMAAYHHERWDGKGYPEGLEGEVIPLSARIMAVADVFDALASPRVYKPAFPLEKALSIITEGSGTQFDPKCVEVFMDSLTEVKLILKKYHEDDHGDL
ncbi:MAG: HD domain-containing protein [Lachnospiraceae bacterium]|nr:HD domain-containing protein [Lachnospiraceae bacterium]